MPSDAQSADIKHPQLISLPIFWQVLGLSLCVLILSLGINTLVVLKAPAPPPSGYTLSEAAKALKGTPVKLQNGHTLTSTSSASEPDFVSQIENNPQRFRPFQSLIATRLANELHVPSDTLWISFPHRDDFFDRNHGPHNAFDPSTPPPGNGPNGGPSAGPNNGPNGSPNGGGGFTQGGDPPPGNMPPHFEDRIGPINEPGRPQEHPSLRATDTRAEVVYPAFSAAWKVADGTYRIITPPKGLIEPWQERLLLGFGLTALCILPLAWLLSQHLSRPIIAFSEAAAKLSIEDDAPPVLSVGPREVRAAADVLNEMQARIKKQVESRTALMAAIAHDLKTPLARMRLRIEDLPAAMRDKLNGDIGHMDGLIRSAMSFTSAHKMNETLRPLDLSALVETICEDLNPLCEMGPALIENNIMVKGDPVALKRIVTNLVENAGRYAGGCHIELSKRGSKAELRIIDAGPGLPPNALETVFEPFFRLESSRNRDTGGTGLGLSVARSLTEAQGGTLTVSNRYEGIEITGLEALLVMPILKFG